MKISVIIPTYNRAHLLGQTVDSVLSQKRAPDEVIIVDDGSTDDTCGVVAPYGERVIYRYQTNAYQSAARNTGQALSTGDLLCFLDSDDLLLPPALGALEKALEAAPEAALAYCRTQIIDGNGTVLQRRAEKEDYQGDVWRRLAEANFLFSTGCALIRRSHLLRQGPWDVALRGVEDWDMWLRLAESAPFVRVDEPLFQYRAHGGNMSANARAMRAMELAVYTKHRARHRNDPDRLRHLTRRCAQVSRRVAASPAREPSRLQVRHRLLRAALRNAGLAELYRRVPFSLRLRMRGLFGVDRGA